MATKRRLIRTIALASVVLVGGTGVVGLLLAGGGVLWLRTDSGNEFIREQALSNAAPFIPNGTLEVAELDTDLFTGIRLSGIALKDAEGRPLVQADSLVLGYNLRHALDSKVEVTQLVLNKPVIDVGADKDGVLDILRALGLDEETDEEEPPSEPAPWIDIPADIKVTKVAIVDGSLRYRDVSNPDAPMDVRVGGLNFKGAATVAGRKAALQSLQLDVATVDGIEGVAVPQPIGLKLDAAYDESQLALNALSLDAGGIRVRMDGSVADVDTDHLDLNLVLKELFLPEVEVEALAGPDFGEDGVLWGDLALNGTVTGPLSALVADIRAQTPGGEFTLKAGADTSKEVMPWNVAFSTSSLKVEKITPQVPEPVHLAFDLTAVGEGVGGVDDMLIDFKLRAKKQVVWNEPLHQLRVTGRLDHGSLDLQELFAVHDVGTVSARGTIGITNESVFISDLRADVPDLRRLSRFGVSGIGGRVAYRGAVTVDGFGEGGVLVADGQVDVDALAVEDAASVQRISGPLKARVELDTNRVDASGQIELLGIAAPSTTLDRLAVDLSAIVLPSGVVSAEAGLEIDKLSVADGAVAIDQIRTAAEQRVKGGVDASGKPWATGGLVISDMLFGTARYAAEGGPIGFAFRDPADPEAQREERLAIDFNLDRRGDQSFFHGDVSGDLLTNEWRIDGLVIAPTDESPLVAAEPVTFRLADGGARDIKARLVGDVGIVDVRGNWVPDATNETDLSAVIEKVNLPHVSKVFSLFVAPDEDTGKGALDGLEGLASVYISLKDNGGPMYVDLGVDLEDVSFPGAVKDLTVEATVRGPQTRPALKAKISGPDGLLAAINGAAPLAWPEGAPQLDCAEDLELQFFVTPGNLERFARIAPGVEVPDALLSAEISAGGDACDPDFTLVSALSAPVGSGGERVRVDFDLARRAGDLKFRGGVEQGLVRILDINGGASTQLSSVFEGVFAGAEMPPLDQLSTFASQFDINVVPLGIPLQSLNAFVELPATVTGMIGGGLNFSGTPSAPRLQGGLVWTGGTVGDVKLDDAHFYIVPVEGGYKLDGRLGFDRTGELAIDGFLPLELDLDRGGDQDLGREGLTVKIKGSTIPLAALRGTVDGVLDASGDLSMTGSLSGTLSDPKPRLGLSLSDGLLSFETTGLTYQNIGGQVDFDGSALKITDLSMGAEPIWGITIPSQKDGKLTIDGTVQLDSGYSPTELDILTKTDGFWLIYTPETQMRADSRVKVAGTYPKLKVSGRAMLLDGKVTLGQDVFLPQSDLALDPVLVIHRKSEEMARKKVAKDGPDVVQEMEVDLKLDLSQGLRLMVDMPLDAQSGATAALSTTTVDMKLLSPMLKISMEKGEPSISGEVSMERGSMTLLGSNFEIASGSTLNFTGADYGNPVLNVEAVRHTGRYGDVSAVVRGTPAALELEFKSDDYPDQTDIISILVMGKPASELTESEGQAGAGMLMAAASMAAGSAFKGASSVLSNVELDEEAVRVGFPLTEKTFLSFERANNAEEDENIFSVSLEWLINRRMYAEMVTGDRGQSSGDIYMRWRF